MRAVNALCKELNAKQICHYSTSKPKASVLFITSSPNQLFLEVTPLGQKD